MAIAGNLGQGFGNGPAAAKGNAVLVQKFVIQPQNDPRGQQFQLIVQLLQNLRECVLVQFSGAGTGFSVLAPEFVVTEITRRQEGFQCTLVFVHFLPVPYRQPDLQDTGGWQFERSLGYQKGGQFE